jgi:hypothetical protein
MSRHPLPAIERLRRSPEHRGQFVAVQAPSHEGSKRDRHQDREPLIPRDRAGSSVSAGQGQSGRQRLLIRQTDRSHEQAPLRFPVRQARPQRCPPVAFPALQLRPLTHPRLQKRCRRALRRPSCLGRATGTFPGRDHGLPPAREPGLACAAAPPLRTPPRWDLALRRHSAPQ